MAQLYHTMLLRPQLCALSRRGKHVRAGRRTTGGGKEAALQEQLGRQGRGRRKGQRCRLLDGARPRRVQHQRGPWCVLRTGVSVLE